MGENGKPAMSYSCHLLVTQGPPSLQTLREEHIAGRLTEEINGDAIAVKYSSAMVIVHIVLIY